MEIQLKGVRGSIPCATPETSFYGGNTACIAVRTLSGIRIFFDAGSGLRGAGENLPPEGECHLFLSHGHLDHILGLNFFCPLYLPGWTTHIYLPASLMNLQEQLFTVGLSPIKPGMLLGSVLLHPVGPGDTLELPSPDRRGDTAFMEVLQANHPGGGLAFRLGADGAMLAYSGDHEITDNPRIRDMSRRMLQGADLAVVDAMFGRADAKPGWGHSCWEDWLEVAKSSDPRPARLILAHHAPSRTDEELDTIQCQARGVARSMSVQAGRENARFTLAAGNAKGRATPVNSYERTSSEEPPRLSNWLQTFLDELAKYKDESVILERILAKARDIAHADAGTIFLAEGRELIFSYTHNDTLFPADTAAKNQYATSRLPVSEGSVAGYAAMTGNTLNIPDVRRLPPHVPYSFNSEFDESSGYRTRSMLVVPFHDAAGKLSGVLQLINCTDGAPSGGYAPFPRGLGDSITILAREAAHFLELSGALRKGIYRMLHMAAVHDPTETGPHAERVGAIAAELYQVWAGERSLDQDLVRFERSQIRLAAMLHDIGKVGISDLILKKPGKLSEDEFAVMRSHTEIGAAILDADSDDLAGLAKDIATHHHQKWNGQGYGGDLRGALAGQAIPLAARITAVADVFDALVSPRCYKKPWPFDQAMALLREEAGGHFDPDLVRCMEAVEPLLIHIYERFPEVYS